MTKSATAAGETQLSMRGHGFGTMPVFLASLTTILGAVMFLRFGYAVGHLGLMGTLLLIVIGHLVTIPTALAVAEIATNRRVEGGGEYYMISRSFGLTIGGAIGISLYLSQAISVAFYMIAFAEAFEPIYAWLQSRFYFTADPRLVSLPATFLLVSLMLHRGATMGVRALWIIFGILVAALALFFLGTPTEAAQTKGAGFFSHVEESHNFIRVFAIVFPAFTGMTAGVGLSGDLKNPGRSIPLGTLAATLTGMVVYVFIVAKLAASATPEELAGDQLVMARIAAWGPIVYFGLAAATVSSAVGSILIAPRTLQALARDRVLPTTRVNAFLARGKGPSHEPVHATLVSGIIALVFVAMGSVDFVAQIISLFFMVTYGALCTVSFLEHFAANPSYRPAFRSRWYISALGAAMCLLMMWQMQPLYALLALAIMIAIYRGLRYTHQEERSLSAILEGVMFQLTRRLQIALQQSLARRTQVRDWRPSFLAITRHSLDRVAHYELLSWLCHRHGFGEFIQFIEGELSAESAREAEKVEAKLIRRTELSRSGVYVTSLVAPSYKAALAQALQLPGISGLPNNSVLFEFEQDHPEEIDEVVEGARTVAVLGFNVCILRSSDARFGFHRTIHLWLTEDDLENAPLMILLAYILLGHPVWEEAEIRLFACYPAEKMEAETKKLQELIAEGRLPISWQRVTPVPYNGERSFERAAAEQSSEADLVILGLAAEQLRRGTKDVLLSHKELRDILFVNANEKILIS